MGSQVFSLQVIICYGFQASNIEYILRYNTNWYNTNWYNTIIKRIAKPRASGHLLRKNWGIKPFKEGC
jgi:hypothetical protein